MCRFFDLVFWQQLATTIIGVAIGAWAAMALERRRGRLAGEKRDRALTDLLRDGVDRNVAVLKRMTELLEKGQSPSQRVSPVHFSWVLSAAESGLTRDEDLRGRLANLVWMTDHLNRRANDLAWLELLDVAGTQINPTLKRDSDDLVRHNEREIRSEMLRLIEKTQAELAQLVAQLPTAST